MRLFGFEVSVQKAVVPRSLQSVDDSHGWVSILDRPPGAFQQDVPSGSDGRALSNWAFFSCMTLIAADIGKLGPQLKEWDDDAEIYERVESNAVTPVLEHPNEYQSWAKFIQSWMLSKVSRGNAYILLDRDARNVVVAMHVLDPDRCTPLISESGEVFYRLGEDRLAQVRGADVVLPASELIHDRMWCLFHPLVGLSPLFATSLAAIQGLEIQGQSARFFRNSAVPSGILVTPQKIDDELAKQYKQRFETNYGGANRGRVAVLGNGLEYKQVTMNAVDAEVIGQLKLSGEMICSTLHVPAFKVGLGPIPTYQNVQALNGIYYSDCLQSLITDVQQGLRGGLDLRQKGYTLHLNLEDLLLMDTQTQIEVAARGVEKAIFAPDEARRKFNLPPVPGGQFPMLQQQNFSLEALAKRDAKADPFETAKPPPAPAPAAPAPAAPPKAIDAAAMRIKFGDGLRRAA